ncbi:hypothetical protein ACHOLT_12635 [Desulfitobacterium sp. Sab5]|uniref:hypothetical protein n=1 Tax=Desulfitobacterium nosdiversum TaxID=3375356 RepID=UPI003CF04D28
MLDKVSINFCGGCNPWINRSEIAEEVTKMLHARDIQVVFNHLDADLVIYLSGCSSNCAQKYSKGNVPCIAVAGTAVDALALDANQIVLELGIRVRNYL